MTRTASIAALVLLAGCGGSSSPSAATPTHHTPGPLADTWAWDGGAWHQTANTGPAPRYSASLAYDAARGVYIMFGGQTARATSDENLVLGRQDVEGAIAHTQATAAPGRRHGIRPRAPSRRALRRCRPRRGRGV